MASNGAVARVVWVRVYYKGKEEEILDAIKITTIAGDVHDLKIEVFPAMNVLQIAEVKVYAPGTDISATVRKVVFGLEN
jgi:hypothetical protein